MRLRLYPVLCNEELCSNSLPSIHQCMCTGRLNVQPPDICIAPKEYLLGTLEIPLKADILATQGQFHCLLLSSGSSWHGRHSSSGKLPIPTSYHLVPESFSCHLVFSYQAPHSVCLNFNLISLKKDRASRFHSCCLDQLWNGAEKVNLRGCVCAGGWDKLSCGCLFFGLLEILGHSQWIFLTTFAKSCLSFSSQGNLLGGPHSVSVGSKPKALSLNPISEVVSITQCSSPCRDLSQGATRCKGHWKFREGDLSPSLCSLTIIKRATVLKSMEIGESLFCELLQVD